MASNNNTDVEVTVKLAILPFPVTLTMWEEEYIDLLKSYEHLGFTVTAILMQQLETQSVWRQVNGTLLISPVWGKVEMLSEELPDDYEV